MYTNIRRIIRKAILFVGEMNRNNIFVNFMFSDKFVQIYMPSTTNILFDVYRYLKQYKQRYKMFTVDLTR